MRFGDTLVTPGMVDPSALAYSKVQYDALKGDMTKFVVYAGVGGLVSGFILARAFR